MNPLEQRLRYKFRNPLLLAEALTHPSLGHETQRHHFDYQRLEYLGDAVLQLIFTEYLFDRFPSATEGDLTQTRATLVSREGLRLLAQRLDLGRYLMMGRGEESSGGRERASALSDAYEAVVGAIYLDSDYVSARRVVLQEAREHLEDLQIAPSELNPKGMLQEILQSITPISPTYPILHQSGPEHDKRFVAQIEWNGIGLGVGEGRSKKEAEISAARDALSKKLWERLPIPSGSAASTKERPSRGNGHSG
ncbi:MAG: ribonuclease III [Chthoniobacteraceae bacterium]